MSALRTSIALATYQGARFLEEQLESFRHQTRLPDEVVISDDHSSDETDLIVEAFIQRASFPVKFIKNDGPRGITRNFENAVAHCSHEIILFSDHDDVWLPAHVERLAGLLELHEQVLAVSSNSVVVDEQLRRQGYTHEDSLRYPKRLHKAVMRFPKNQLELIVRQRDPSGHGLAFRRSLFPLLFPFHELCLHDWWVYMLAASAGSVGYISEPLTLYRTHQSQTMGGEKKSMLATAAGLAEMGGDEAPFRRPILERLRERPGFARDFEYAERLLAEKIEFIERRTRTRKLGLPRRAVATFRELLIGRYHRLGRGFTTYARDLYGDR